MLFWRSKFAKRVVDAVSVSAEERTSSVEVIQKGAQATANPANTSSSATVEAVKDAAAKDADAVAKLASSASTGDAAAVEQTSEEAGETEDVSQSKVISISSAVRLSERLADVHKLPVASGGKATTVVASKAESRSVDAAVAEDGAVLALDLAAQREIEAVLSGVDMVPAAAGDVPSHILIFGASGTGRVSVVEASAREVARQRPRGDDCIYVALNGDGGSRLGAFRVPAGTGLAICRDVSDALMKASAMLARHVAGDGHQMSLAMLEEDHRQKNSGGIDQLRRRAEAQNIALVNTSEGYVLAPMHEGRVVRADVFRALPEALQHDVEAKIAVFESELQSLLQSLPGSDIATDDRHVALCEQTAERALKPSMGVARKLTSAADGANALIDAVEVEWLRGAVDYVRRGNVDDRIKSLSLSVVSAMEGECDGEGAPVVVAHTVRAADLVGEVGRDAKGDIAVRPGALSLASGGFLIVEAWRLGNDPEAYSALSAALDKGEIVPLTAAGVAVSADPIPLSATVVVVGDLASLQKLKAIDPGVERHFIEVVRFDGSAAAFEVTEDRFLAWVRALADDSHLLRFDKACGSVLYDDARSRAGDRSRVSLDRRAVLATLALADRKAAAAKRDQISVEDLKAAIESRAVLRRFGDPS